MGMQMTAKTHRLGVIAVTETKLYVIETGTVVGEKVEPVKVLGASGQVKTKSFDLKDVTVQDSESAAPGTLAIAGAIHIRATFPRSYEWENEDRAAQIVGAIEAAKQRGQR